jgi:hypothetical protein
VKTTALALGCVLALGLSGCGGDDEPKPKVAEPTAPPSSLPASVGTVQGRLLLVGGPAPGAESAAPGKLRITRPGSSVKADIGEDGTYAIQLAPGSYRITATSPKYDNSDGTCRTDPPVTVIAAGKTVTADVYCVMK